MEIKTSQERAAMRHSKRMEVYKKIAERYETVVSEGVSKSDAAVICANEFACSLPTIYKARKEYDKSIATD